MTEHRPVNRCREMSYCYHLYVTEQLKPAYTECRAANGPCDLPEYCDGTDPVCPSNVYRRNTDSCSLNGVRQQSFFPVFLLTARDATRLRIQCGACNT